MFFFKLFDIVTCKPVILSDPEQSQIVDAFDCDHVDRHELGWFYT